ncbi:hypothetical protein ACRE_068350 [Hapsidospora chrysogenum ATCC 11550]|uniref:CRIB domain-containing protein n=1 Tax=Hapsidospora chrysogenum (strain ATCC 11550 / CBS 779.69 / DSM 880 / IAM 14645 / JCM 23072 / IMI 49137) TaxID=857340 RepID=A0A086SZ97_HAPC1|nr:hypothetical protein ACRE_068350 [Hapsidospora chrysogenum ATCC 11550]
MNMLPAVVMPPPGAQPSQAWGRRKRTDSRAVLKESLSIPSLPRGDSDNANHVDHHATPDIDYMEPAMERPPSPQRLRQLSKQMKRASYLNRPRPQRNESSSPSPRRAMDRSPWEQAFDSLSLSRQPSNRSTTSSDPPRERAERESVHALGKNLFQRNNKSKRASSSYSSSNSSMYSAETPGETTSRDSLLPSLFNRRKPSRDDTAQKRLQISGPFNFQHVAHTQRENLPDIQRGNRMNLASEFSTVRIPGPATAPGVLKIPAHDLHHFPNDSIDSVDMVHEINNVPLSAPPSRPALHTYHTAPSVGSHYGLRAAKSQELLRSSPVTSPRSQSPTQTGNPGPTSSPPVPPRMSSRQSLMPDGFSAFASTPLERPRTSGGFRQPQPFDPSESLAQAPPPATSAGFMPPADFEAFGVDERRFSHAVTTPDETAWPLSANASPSYFDNALPDVPEEEEQIGALGRSRLSLTSNNSSLRGSQSVPALRAFSQAQRPSSGASDTLGPFNAAAARRATRSCDEEAEATSPLDDNWEDDIDYCYEHEADANFDYQWERPSMDGHRNQTPLPIQLAVADDELAEANPALAAGNYADAPAQYSPRKQVYGSGGESVTPVGHLGVTSNFSLPRGEKGSRVSQLKGIRPVSYASSFRESHGFNLSPSLLIPGDFHQQMLADKYEYQDDEILAGPFQDEMRPGTETKSPLLMQHRSSTSTTATNSSTHTDTTGERHVSANSTFTAMTRLTISSSSTSLNKAAGVVPESIEPMPPTQLIDNTQDHDGPEKVATSPANRDTVPELTPFPVMNFAKKPYHRSHASESVVRDEITPLKSQDPAKLRRPRARTSSLSAQVAPPVGQYALFPRSHVKGNGNRI